MKNLKYLLFLAFLVQFGSISAQYKLDFKVKGLENQAVQFAYYYADQQYILLTDTTDEKGRFSFSGKEKLARGLYLVILPKKLYFDVLVADDQEFSMEADTADITKSMKIKGSEENANFYQFQQEIIDPVKERQKLAERKFELPEGHDSIAILSRRIDEISSFTENIWKVYADKNKNSFLNTLLTAFNGEPVYNYSDEDFFNYINFADSGLVRSPVLNRACKLILARNLNGNKPASVLKKEVTNLLNKAEANQEVFAYIFTHFLNFFHSFQRDGINELFVYFYDDYILKGKTPWFNEKAMEQIKNQADIFRYSLVGSKAYELNLETLSGEFSELYHLDFETTFVFFWSTGCGHCEEASDVLRDFYLNNKQLDLAIYSVYTKDNRTAWAEFQEKHGTLDWINVWDPKNESEYKQHYYIASTPIMYVLNRDKKIIGKLMGDGPIKKYLDNFNK